MFYSSNLVLSRRLAGHVAQVGCLRSPRHSGRRAAAIRNLDVLDFWIPGSRNCAPRNDENQ
jgi:hypothetical protein